MYRLTFFEPSSGLPPCTLPLMAWPVCAGFPSPADDHMEARLDINELLVTHQAATFIVRVAGSSMTIAGINDGDLLIVNRALQAVHGDIVVALLDGEHTVKRLHMRGADVRLLAANAEYSDITFTEGQNCEIWGVVTSVIKRFRS
jgi:DNA polymerase V